MRCLPAARLIRFAFGNAVQDAESLENVISEAQDMLPAMRAEHAKLMQELQEEQAIADEIDNSDQDYLNELKNTISDQACGILTVCSP